MTARRSCCSMPPTPTPGGLTPILKALSGTRRLHRRHAGDGLEHGRGAPHAQGAAIRRRLARLPDDLGLGRPARPRHVRLPRRQLREGGHRLAVRRQTRGTGATLSPRRPTTPGERSSPRRSRSACRSIRRTSSSASSTCPSAIRTSVTGNLEAPAPVFWNVKKKQ